jgi:hypothetical protein
VGFFAISVGQLLKTKELTSPETSGFYYPLTQRHSHKEWSRHCNERSDSIKNQGAGGLILDYLNGCSLSAHIVVTPLAGL